MPEYKYTREDLKTMQGFSLERKIQIAQTRIIEFLQAEDIEDKTKYISFSGGKDSTVLLDLVRRVDPSIEAIFVDTGLEFPEIRSFVKTVPNVRIIRPDMRFDQVIKQYGYPLISKDVASTLHYARQNKANPDIGVWAINRLNGKNPDGSSSTYKESNFGKYKDFLYYPVKVSDKCCKILKEKPLKSIKNAIYFIGTTAGESERRTLAWRQTGCVLIKGSKSICKPLSIWTEQDILEYIKRFNLPYATVYGDIVEEEGKLRTTGRDRTGCMFCPFGAQCRADKRYLKLAESHPKQYNYCIGGGEFDENGFWVPNKEGLGLGYIFDNWIPEVKYKPDQ